MAPLRWLGHPLLLLGALFWITNTHAFTPVHQRVRRVSTSLWQQELQPEEDPRHRSNKLASPERPTLTNPEVPLPPLHPPKPKIVVLGASGQIGRLVVRQLLESSLDITIVALVRNYDKACRVLYDDFVVAQKQKKGPKLQIVQGDLVPPEDLPGYTERDHEEVEWQQRAFSAAQFYGNSLQDYDNRHDGGWIDPNEALQDAIQGCSTIISCVGSVRPTALWSDFLARPLWRILRPNVSSWCQDPRHPYYVQYKSHWKALSYAEREQRKKEAADLDAPRIRFVRISDLCVSQQPWHFVPLLTNIFHSMVFRYHDMTDEMLKASSLIDTVILRPGDLVDEERDAATTALQVDPSGWVPTPARVGREDVASLAVAAALFDTSLGRQKKAVLRGEPAADQDPKSKTAFHYTLGVRWVGEDMKPYPAQGCKADGHPTADACLRSILRTLKKQGKRERRLNLARSKAKYANVARLATTLSGRRKQKPFGICAAIPVYLFLGLLAKTLLQSTPPAWVAPFAQRASRGVATLTTLLYRYASALVRQPLFAARTKTYISL